MFKLLSPSKTRTDFPSDYGAMDYKEHIYMAHGMITGLRQRKKYKNTNNENEMDSRIGGLR
jgi:hypothetical protein